MSRSLGFTFAGSTLPSAGATPSTLAAPTPRVTRRIAATRDSRLKLALNQVHWIIAICLVQDPAATEVHTPRRRRDGQLAARTGAEQAQG